MTTKRLFSILLTVLLMVPGPGVSVAGQPQVYEKEPGAIEILEAGDGAIRSLHGLRFGAEYVGAFTARGRVSSQVTLRRETGLDEAMQTIAYSLKSEVRAEEAPYAQEHYPRQYTLIETGGQTRLIDADDRTVQVARGQDRVRLNYGALTSGVLPQYLRPDPLQFEIEDSIGARYLGTTTLDGTKCHLVWLKFADESGFGEQLLYFGVDDRLLRKATLVAPETSLPDRPGAAPAANPSIFMELTMRGVEVLANIPDTAFSADYPEFRETVLGGEARVGELAPDWSLPLPGGGTITSRDLRGSAVVLYFWASWCPTCHRYMPAVQDIHDRFSGRIRVIGVNAFDRDDALAHIRERGYTFKVALDGDALLSEVFGFPGQPAMVVLDRDGVVRYRALARDPADEELWALLSELAGEDH